MHQWCLLVRKFLGILAGVKNRIKFEQSQVLNCTLGKGEKNTTPTHLVSVWKETLYCVGRGNTKYHFWLTCLFYYFLLFLTCIQPTGTGNKITQNHIVVISTWACHLVSAWWRNRTKINARSSQIFWHYCTQSGARPLNAREARKKERTATFL